jgi:hypothetical protein
MLLVDWTDAPASNDFSLARSGAACIRRCDRAGLRVARRMFDAVLTARTTRGTSASTVSDAAA